MSNYLDAVKVFLRDMGYSDVTLSRNMYTIRSQMYVAQELGMPFNYKFTYFEDGMSSTDLDDDIENIIGEGFYSIEEKCMTENYRKIVHRLKEIGDRNKDFKLNCCHGYWWRVISRVVYWRKQGITNKFELINKLAGKPFYLNEAIIAEAYNVFGDETVEKSDVLKYLVGMFEEADKVIGNPLYFNESIIKEAYNIYNSNKQGKAEVIACQAE